MRKLLISLGLILSFFTANNVKADEYDDFCMAGTKQIPVSIDVIEGNLEYIHDLKNANFAKYLKKDMDIKQKIGQRVTGLTVAQASFSLHGKAEVMQKNNRYCVKVHDINIGFGYPKMVVLIDKKYKEGSCEYYNVKEHENTHISLNREVLYEYVPLIQSKAEEVVNRIEPMEVYTKAQAQAAFQDMIDKNRNELTPYINEFENEQARRNLAIDTLESYKELNALCNNW